MDGRDLTIPPAGAHDLIRVIHSDERFEVVQVTSLDGEDGEDKKVSRRVLPSLLHCNHPVLISGSRNMAAADDSWPCAERLSRRRPPTQGCRMPSRRVDCRSWGRINEHPLHSCFV